MTCRHSQHFGKNGAFHASLRSPRAPSRNGAPKRARPSAPPRLEYKRSLEIPGPAIFHFKLVFQKMFREGCHVQRRCTGLGAAAGTARAQLDASRIASLLLPSFLVVIALSTALSFFSNDSSSPRRRIQLEAPQQKGPAVPLQPNAYQPFQEAAALTHSAQESCTAWMGRDILFAENEMQPADRLPLNTKNEEPSVCDWPTARHLNKTLWNSLYRGGTKEFACGANAVRYKLHKGVLYRDR
jgi:hypothetical protein